MKRRIMITGAAALLLLSAVASAFAAPASCPSGQTLVHQGGTWSCVNNGGQDTGAIKGKH